MEMDKQAWQRREKDAGHKIGARKTQQYGCQYDKRKGNKENVFRAREIRRC
jgi:hypothetical protein